MVQEFDGINGVKGTDNREGLGEHKPGSDMTTVVNHLIYDAFGQVTSESNPTKRVPCYSKGDHC
ncbi:MAG: hypothetical protein KatS3mg112_1394 [Thermogutta sp.]|nr:MAG: hypothetical protein KatS3mg112_1394 [Thermogutta sp.]